MFFLDTQTDQLFNDGLTNMHKLFNDGLTNMYKLFNVGLTNMYKLFNDGLTNMYQQPNMFFLDTHCYSLLLLRNLFGCTA
jgi:plasmid replication initiation protein